MNMVVMHWSANVVALAACAAVVVVHLMGMRATAAGAGRQGATAAVGSRRTEAVAFYFGVFTVIVALVSPVAYWSQRYIWVRSVQDLLLAVVAPGLIVLGAPWLVLARGVRRRGGATRRAPEAPGSPAGPVAAVPGRDAQSRGDRRGPRAGGWGAGPWAPRASRWPWQPVAVVAVFNAVWWVWHVPALYDAALAYPVVYAAEVVTYLGLGIGFWLQLIGSWPLAPRLTPLRRVMLIAATIVSDTVLSMGLAFGAGLAYPAYLGPAQSQLQVVQDQQIGGAVLWMLIVPPLTIAAVALLIRWLKNEESEALTAGLDRLLDPPTQAWPSRPGLR